MKENQQEKEDAFSSEIRQKENRMVDARQRRGRSIWLGIGMFGIIGWSVSIPTILGAMLGIWLDENYPGKVSYTLALLVAGLAFGCFNAWYWVAKENRLMGEDQSPKRSEKDKQ